MKCIEDTKIVSDYIEDNINQNQLDVASISKLVEISNGLYQRIFVYSVESPFQMEHILSLKHLYQKKYDL